jgi:hypothetical protein
LDAINLKEKNIVPNLKFVVILVVFGLIGWVLPNISFVMKIVLSVILFICVVALLLSSFFIKNQIIFHHDKLVIDRYNTNIEFPYQDIKNVRYHSELTDTLSIKKHCLIITTSKSKEIVIELFGNVLIEEEINALIRKYNLV